MPKIPLFKQFLKNNISFFTGLALCMLLTAGFIFIDRTFRVKYIRLLSKENKEHPIKGLTSLGNKYMGLLSENESEKLITKNNSYIKEVEITKQYPDTLLVRVTYYSPKAYLKMREGYLLLSDEGRILEKTREKPDSKLPVITYYQNLSFTGYQAGEEMDLKDIQDSIYYLQKLAGMKIAVNSIDIVSFHMLGLYTKNEVFFFSSEKDRSEQDYQLEAAMREFRISGKKFKSLDLRFDKPVVVFE